MIRDDLLSVTTHEQSLLWSPSSPNVDVVVPVYFPVADLAANGLDKGLDVLVQIPTIDSGKWSEAECFETFGEAQIVPTANFLLVGIVRPGIEGRADDCLLNIDEASPLQQLACIMLVRYRTTPSESSVP